MVSKRILLVAICVAVLAVAVGVYAYNSMNSTNTKTFYFESKKSWDDGKTYHMKMTFAIEGENLSITAEIGDKVYNRTTWLGLVFDMDHSGAIEGWEPAYMLYARNESRTPVRCKTAWKSPEGEYLTFAAVEPIPSQVHTCVFNSESGFTFKIQIPLEDLNLTNDLVYMCFMGSTCGFYEEFNFGLGV